VATLIGASEARFEGMLVADWFLLGDDNFDWPFGTLLSPD